MQAAARNWSSSCPPGTLAAVAQSDPLQGLSQVTVGVLFTINSLQIFFLDQNVNAFLGVI